MSQIPLDKIIRALQHNDSDIRKKGINALVRSAEVKPDQVKEVLSEIAGIDVDVDVRNLAERRLEQYRQYIQQQPTSPSPVIQPLQVTASVIKPLQPLPAKAAPAPFAAPMHLEQGTFILHPPNAEYVLGKREKPFYPGILVRMFWLVFWFIVGLLILVYAGFSAKDYYKWSKVATKGTITDIRVNDTDFLWTAVFEYTAADGTVQQGTSPIPDFTTYLELNTGDSIKVEFLDGKPQMLPKEKFGVGTMLGILSGLIFAIGSPINMFILAGQQETLQELVKKGVLLDGIITSAGLNLDGRNASVVGGIAGGGCLGGIMTYVWTTFLNPKHIMTVKYELTPLEGGKVVPGIQKYKRNDLKDKRAPLAGTPVKILYINEKKHFML